jgi:hypothetical protein
MTLFTQVQVYRPNPLDISHLNTVRDPAGVIVPNAEPRPEMGWVTYEGPEDEVVVAGFDAGGSPFVTRGKLKDLTTKPRVQAKTQIQASIDGTGLMTVTAIDPTGISKPMQTILVPKALVTGPNVPTGTLINEQKSGLSGGAGTYQLSTSGVVVGSSLLVVSSDVVDPKSNDAKARADIAAKADADARAKAAADSRAKAVANQQASDRADNSGLQPPLQPPVLQSQPLQPVLQNSNTQPTVG